MTSRPRTLPWLVLAALAASSAGSRGQDAPLYRDPSPTEGARIEGPLLPPAPPRPGPAVPPPSGLGPFRPQGPGTDVAESPGEPLLVIAPMPPPLPSLPMAPMTPGGDGQFRRKTTIRPPCGPHGRFHDWARESLFGPPRPPAPAAATAPRRGLLDFFPHHDREAEAPARSRFIWPTWPPTVGP